MSDQTPYYLAFSYAPGIGPYRFSLLLEEFKTVENIYNASKLELGQILGPRTVEKFLIFRKEFRPHSISNELYKKGIHIIPFGSPEYPMQLVHIPDPPICLYLRGNVKLLSEPYEKYIAIVGTRVPSTYGRITTRQCARLLSDHGYIIVSGMAYGIDSEAHAATLDVNGKTVAVLGCGLEAGYPYTGGQMAQRIIDGGGAIISEFSPAAITKKGFFVTRNRLVSGLCKAVVVVEGSDKSGTLTTAKYAQDQGRDLFAVPSNINSYLSKAPNFLISQGATIVTAPEDILKYYNIKPKQDYKKFLVENLNEDEARVADHLAKEFSYADDIARKLKIPIILVSNTLTTLELKGIIAKNDKGEYYISNGHS